MSQTSGKMPTRQNQVLGLGLGLLQQSSWHMEKKAHSYSQAVTSPNKFPAAPGPQPSLPVPFSYRESFLGQVLPLGCRGHHYKSKEEMNLITTSLYLHGPYLLKKITRKISSLINSLKRKKQTRRESKVE